jgi:tetratricopeptide (TPR) repeat protein
MGFRVRCLTIALGLIGALLGFSTPSHAFDFAASTDCQVYAVKPGSNRVAFGIQQCTRALESGPVISSIRVRVLEARATGYAIVKQFERAIQDQSEAIKLFPKDATRYVKRGDYQSNKGDLDAALADYNQALKLNPKSAPAYLHRSYVWHRRGITASQLADLDRAIEIEPVNAGALNARCWTLLESGGDLGKALADCDAAIRLEPDNALVLHSRCAVRLAREDYRGAEEDCSAALTKGGEHALYFADRGRAREKLGTIEQARADYENALKLKATDKFDESAHVHARERIAALTPAATQPAAAPLPDSSPAAPALPGQKRIVLVIGNSAYKGIPALPNPTRDADLVARTFRQAGFHTVTLAKDLSREMFIEALRKFSAEAEGADWAAVYFAGHGMEINGVNYLIPVDAKLASDRAVPYETVSMDQVTLAVEGAKRLRLVLIDACRDNPFINQMRRTVASRSIGRGMASIEPEAGILVVYAAKHGQIALDGEGENSPFVTALAKRMLMPGVDIRRVFDHVRDDVMEATQRRQQPFSYGSLSGSEDFMFVAKR